MKLHMIGATRLKRLQKDVEHVVVTEMSTCPLPIVLPEAGLSAERRKYLLENIAGFCHPENKDDFIADLGGD